jgi:hypothetical protein
MEGERERERGSGSHGWFTGTPGSRGLAGEAGEEESTEITEGPDIARGAKGERRTKHEALHDRHGHRPLEGYRLHDKLDDTDVHYIIYIYTVSRDCLLRPNAFRVGPSCGGEEWGWGVGKSSGGGGGGG